MSDSLIYCSSTNNKLKLHQRLEFDSFFKVKRIDNNKKYGNKCFEINSTQKSFLCVCENNLVRESWCDDIQRCLDNINFMKNDQQKTTRILEVAPVWFPDDFSDKCMNPECMKKFTFTRRRHHCRYCGYIICQKCGEYKLPHFNTSDNSQMVRVDIMCYNKYRAHFNIEPAQKSTKKLKRTSIILNHIKTKKKRASLSSFASLSSEYNINPIAPIPSTSTPTITSYASSNNLNMEKMDELNINASSLPISFYHFQQKQIEQKQIDFDFKFDDKLSTNNKSMTNQINTNNFNLDKFRVVVDDINLYKDKDFKFKVKSTQSIKNKEKLDGFYIDDSFKIVYLPQFKVFISSMDVREIGDDEDDKKEKEKKKEEQYDIKRIIMTLDEFMKHRPNKKELCHKNILKQNDIENQAIFREKVNYLEATKTLKTKLNQRPSFNEIASRGIFKKCKAMKMSDNASESMLILDKISKVTINKIDCLRIICKDSHKKRTLIIPCEKLMKMMPFGNRKNRNYPFSEIDASNISL